MDMNLFNALGIFAILLVGGISISLALAACAKTVRQSRKQASKPKTRAIVIAFAAAIAILPFEAGAQEAMQHGKTTPGQTLTYEIRTADDTVITGNVSEGPSGWYYVLNTTLSAPTDDLDSRGVYPFTLLSGSQPVADGTLYWSGSVAQTPEQYLLGETLSDTGAGKLGRVLAWLSNAFASDGVLSAASLTNAPVTSQPRVNKRAGKAYRLNVSRRTDGTYKCVEKVRLRPGTVNNIAVELVMEPIYGDVFVEEVGVPTVSGGSLTCSMLGPRDTSAMVELAGTVEADEKLEVTVDVEMETGESEPVTFDVWVTGG